MPRIHRLILPLLALSAVFLIHYVFSPSAHANHLVSEHSTDPLSSPSSHDSRSSSHNARTKYNAHRHPSLRPEGNDVAIDQRGLTAFDPEDALHPIERLIARGKRLAKALSDRIDQVKSLEDAVEDYERAYGMKAPRGFDRWYSFTQSAPLPRIPPLASLFPLAHNPFLFFLSLPTSRLRDLVADAVENQGQFFSFSLVPDGQGDIGTACKSDEQWEPEDWYERGRGRVIVKGEAAWTWRSNNTLSLILPILPLLPPELFIMKPALQLAFTNHDGPRGMIHHDLFHRGEALGRAGKFWPQVQLDKAERQMGWTYGWQWACPAGSPLKIQSNDKVLNDLPVNDGSSQQPLLSPQGEKSFIADFDRAADFCLNPEMTKYHHVLLADSSRAAGDITPIIAPCKTMHNSDIVGVPLDGVFEQVDYVPWEEKPIGKAFWRGTATGMFHNKNNPWRDSQRERLHFLAHNTSDVPVDILLEKPGGGLKVESWDRNTLNHAWMDIGLAGQPVQCSEEDGSCGEMAREIEFVGRVPKQEAIKYKFVIDVDGNGWSSRFRRLLAGNNVVLKSTVYTEWFHETLIPWYHYVPLKLDYTDIYDILAFFIGSPDGSTSGRDDLAREIAENGLRFTEDNWRMEDMQSFMFLLILEYGRLMSDDRAAAVYTK